MFRFRFNPTGGLTIRGIGRTVPPMQDRTNPPPGASRRSTPDRAGRRFLIVRLSALGDVLHTLPAVLALRRAEPHARIDWLVEDRHAALLLGLDAIDRVVIVPRARWKGARARPWRWPLVLRDLSRLAIGLVRARYDATIDVQGNLKSGLASLLTGAPVRYGFPSSDVREANALLTTTHVRVPPQAVHRADRAFAMMEAVVGHPLVRARDRLAVDPEGAAWAEHELERAGLRSVAFAVFHPGTSGFGSFKRWPAERFGRLARDLDATGRRVVVTVGPGEEALGAAVRAAAGERAIVVAPPGLPALAALIARAAVFVSADTGPLHVAAAHGVPVVALFGPKDEATYGPYAVDAARAAVVTSADVPCRPCTLRRCPDPVCMTSIDVETVLARVTSLLSKEAC